MFVHISALSFFVLVVFIGYYFRQRIYSFAEPYLPTSVIARLSNYQPLQTFSFQDQAAAGMSSSNFDLEANMGEGSGENRVGLDEEAVEEVRRIMAVERCTFDRARLIRHNRILAKNGIAPDGTPLDRKAVTRL
ncbi:hypothetical protein CcaverHIS002_0203280 [Cutaneotrichosporon cavernicola]|uniref:Uncharacterized protein n=1 Tax=Cutaneotrichosporon cavernicola TaxID=279322 RepID=A0AA48I8D2_9TREE|nr:uncharacterized protein CcaverHIS019_0203270 [Cutaneotrichosporon cavernicola]BEJ11867.1 hypothetical protein CspHIS471_0203270 [Cutaneotrichosporon sp. HIS471]BEI81168.1 hypothetical protein CcaverHIS002_0203280 [Cutaneotrichosporon cavernicola]BEI88965.1 hypothetical protein CcaverHIS019_0203270 [Cutaneotrichosporon cavernicola]BEI96742.1 hypothetical protein CcaverHIS631_0203310 [Cutaneotrichosporon cavernicola]BEJ04514.1 hypothetical protein CcaverHIS641_0203310 [Cutaneotrichosporon cav